MLYSEICRAIARRITVQCSSSFGQRSWYFSQDAAPQKNTHRSSKGNRPVATTVSRCLTHTGRIRPAGSKHSNRERGRSRLQGGTMPCFAYTSVNRSEEHTSELQSRLHLVCR